MKKSTLIISWVFYLLSLIILIVGYALHSSETPSWSLLSLISITLTTPWIICILNAIKNKKSGLWIFGLIFSGMLVIPFYLIKQTRK